MPHRCRRHARASWTPGHATPPRAAAGDRVGLGRSTVGAIECGQGGGHTLDTWQRLGLAVGRPLRIELGRDVLEAPADAGHLAIQELLLRLGRAAGFTGTFELPIRPADTRHAIDVCLRDDGQRLLRLREAWNTFGDIGAAARSFAWKLAKAEEVAIAIGGERPYRVRGVWVVRATARNRALVGRYPAVFGARFPGSSVGQALSNPDAAGPQTSG